MKSQKQIFKEGEGDRWFDRNRREAAVETEQDPGLQLLRSIQVRPQKVLEIGCGNGDRLALIQQLFDARCHGIDPSSKAIADGQERFPQLALAVGTADCLPFEDHSFDTIIFGFCLYLCDRKDLFKIAYEADRCLADEGTVVITDFCPPFPYKNHYSHLAGVDSFKMDYARLFDWNPAYSRVASMVYSHSGFALRDLPDEKVATTVLRKTERYAYPESPFA